METKGIIVKASSILIGISFYVEDDYIFGSKIKYTDRFGNMRLIRNNNSKF